MGSGADEDHPIMGGQSRKVTEGYWPAARTGLVRRSKSNLGQPVKWVWRIGLRAILPQTPFPAATTSIWAVRRSGHFQANARGVIDIRIGASALQILER